MLLRYGVYFLLLTLQLGCSGGEESKPQTITEAPQEAIVEQTESSQETEVQETQTQEIVPVTEDLVVSEEFDFTTDVGLAIDILLDGLDKRAYINVCERPQEGTVNYDSCVYRGPLLQTGVLESVTLSRSDIQLLAEVWFYDGTTEPLYFFWEFDEGRDDQTFMVRAEVSTEEVASVTEDLVTSEEFDFTTDVELAIDALLEDLDQRAYLNVCERTQEGSLDYDSCVYRGPLYPSGIAESVTLSRNDIQLIAEIWFYDGSAEPLYYAWEFDASREDQVFLIR